MHSISFAHSLIGLVMVLISSVSTSKDIKTQAFNIEAFKVQSYASVKAKDKKSYSEDIHVDFTNCAPDGYPIYGNVTDMTITPCHRSSPHGPCTFVFRHNYTIELDFQTTLDSTYPGPRSAVIAYDDDGSYAYSGQSFNGCKYASCPIQAYTPSVYVYHFQTLASPFASLTFNVTQNITGPSLFCASTNITFKEKSSTVDLNVEA